MRQYVIPSLVLVLLLIGTAGLEAQMGEAEMVPEDQILELEGIESPPELREVVSTLSGFDYSVKYTDHSEDEAADMFVECNFLGEEVIEGETADQVQIKMFEADELTADIILWVAEEDFLQVKMNGEIIPPEMADMMVEPLLQSVFRPYYYRENLDLDELKDVADKHREEKGTVGEHEVDIIILEFEQSEEMAIESGEVKVAEFEEILVLAESHFVFGLEEAEFKYEVERLEFRQNEE